MATRSTPNAHTRYGLLILEQHLCGLRMCPSRLIRTNGGKHERARRYVEHKRCQPAIIFGPNFGGTCDRSKLAHPGGGAADEGPGPEYAYRHQRAGVGATEPGSGGAGA